MDDDPRMTPPRPTSEATTQTAARPISPRARRGLAFASVLCALALGLAMKFYDGPLASFIRLDLNGVPYTMAWAFGFAFLAPGWSSARAAAAGFAASCTLEFLQLWHPPLLEALRSTLLGRLALGTTFTVSDFPYYALGALVAFAWLERLPRPNGRPNGIPR